MSSTDDPKPPYREDLHAARYRVNRLEAELREKDAALDARDAAIDELHHQLEQAAPPEPPEPSPWPWILGLSLGGLLLGGAMIAAALLFFWPDSSPAPAPTPPPVPRAAPPTAPGRTYLWQGEPRSHRSSGPSVPPAVGDVNGDGVPDVIGMVTTIGMEGRAFVGAFDGRNADPLWLSEELAWIPEGIGGAFMATTDDTIVATTTKGELLAIRKESGQTLERVAIGAAKTMCEREAGVIVVAKDDRAHRYDPVARAFLDTDESCPDRFQRDRERRAAKDAIPSPKADGLRLVRRLAHDGHAFGLASAGRMKQPEVLAYTPSTGEVTWRVPATGDREQLAKPPFHKAFGVSDDCVFVEVQHATLSAKGPKGTKEILLNCLDPEDGSLRWSVPPPFTDGMTAHFITTPTRLFWVHGDRLDILDAKTGMALGHVGWH